MPYWLAKDRAEYCEPADVGLLARPSSGPKLPERLWAALLSLPPDALCKEDWPRPVGCSWGMLDVPMGVARCSTGSVGRPTGWGGPTGFTVLEVGIARLSMLAGLLFGLLGAFGEGMARPRRGAREPPLGRAPGMAGRRSGTLVGIIGTGEVLRERFWMGRELTELSREGLVTG